MFSKTPKFFSYFPFESKFSKKRSVELSLKKNSLEKLLQLEKLAPATNSSSPKSIDAKKLLLSQAQ